MTATRASTRSCSTIETHYPQRQRPLGKFPARPRALRRKHGDPDLECHKPCRIRRFWLHLKRPERARPIQPGRPGNDQRLPRNPRTPDDGLQAASRPETSPWPPAVARPPAGECRREDVGHARPHVPASCRGRRPTAAADRATEPGRSRACYPLRPAIQSQRPDWLISQEGQAGRRHRSRRRSPAAGRLKVPAPGPPPFSAGEYFSAKVHP